MPPVPGSDLPFFTDADVFIIQYQYYRSTSGAVSRSEIGYMDIPISTAHIPISGAFGTPSVLGPPSYGFVSTWVVYMSQITIDNPYYTPGSYNPNLPDITAGTLGNPTGNLTTDATNVANFQADSVAAGNAAIAQANLVLGNHP